LSWGSILGFVGAVEVLLLLLSNKLFSYHAGRTSELYMCDVSLPAMPGRAVATIVRAEVVMLGTQWQLQRAASCPGAALPTPA